MHDTSITRRGWTLLVILACSALGTTQLHAQNARFFRLDEDTELEYVKDYNWQRHWHSVVSTKSTSGVRMLLFYNREHGQGKSFIYDNSGAITQLGSWGGWGRKWDSMLGGSFLDRDGGSFNAIFYRRSDGLLRAYNFGADGSLTFRFEQNIEDPNGDLLYSKTGWDTINTGHWGGSADGLFFYHRATGTARFYRYDTSTNRFVVAKLYSGFQKIWDEIATGNFDGDRNGIDDVVFYDQDTGAFKILYFDSTYSIDRTRDLPNGAATHGARLAVGHFGGSGREDILLYQHDNGQNFTNGRGMFLLDSSGEVPFIRERTTWQDKWTHVLPVDLGGPRSGLLFYSNQHVIDAWVIPFSVARRVSNFPWTTSDLLRIKAQEDAMRKTYATAGFRFRLLALRDSIGNQALAEWVCGGDHNDRESANSFITDQLPRHAMVFAVAVDSSSGTGCSSLGAEFARVHYPITSKVKHYGHEAGHYFGLPHSHLGLGTRDEIESWLAGLETQYGRRVIAGDLDRDRIGGSDVNSFYPVRDTPPTLSSSFWTSEGGGMCGVGDRVDFDTPMGGVSMWVSPHDVMAYNNCNSIYRLTRDQARVVREVLYERRGGLIDPDAVGPTPPLAPLTTFRRGDTNADRKVDISDAVAGLNFLFNGGPAPECRDSADVNDDGSVDISDFVGILGFIFLGAAEPPEPGVDDCGHDPSDDGLDCSSTACD